MSWGKWLTIAVLMVEIQLIFKGKMGRFPGHVPGGNLVTVGLRFLPWSANCEPTADMVRWASRLWKVNGFWGTLCLTF